MMKRLRTFNIDDKYYEEIKKIAKEQKRSASNMLEILIDLYKAKKIQEMIRMTKTKAVMLHLEEKGSITSWEAIDKMQGLLYNIIGDYIWKDGKV